MSQGGKLRQGHGWQLDGRDDLTSLKYELFIALRYLKAKRKQTFISVITFISIIGVAVGVMALIIALALMTGFHEDIQKRILGANSHITIFKNSGKSEMEDYGKLIGSIKEIPGVVAASPVVYSPGMITSAIAITPSYTLINGIDPSLEKDVTDIEKNMIAGSLSHLGKEREKRKEGIVLGADLAASIGVVCGDIVEVSILRPRLSPWGIAPRTKPFKVVGIFDAGFFEYNSARSYININEAKRFFALNGASWIEVRVESLDILDDVKGKISERIGSGYLVDDLINQNRNFFSALRLEKLYMFISLGLIVLVAALNIISTLILMVMEKVKDIGTLVSMGATSRSIMVIFMLQGLIIGIIGTVTGCISGFILSWIFDKYRLFKLNPEIYFIPYVPFEVRILDFTAVAFLAVVVSFLATLYPSWKASRLDPVEAIRYE
ncbi:MAG: FtsX-like permease family protein [Acidobacteriota bacterium]